MELRETSQVFAGGCHCGNLSVSFTTTIAPVATVPRACQCTFCLRHAARMIADPVGHLTVTIADEAETSRYQFNTRSADFLVCRRCGVFVAAVTATHGVVNVNVLDDRARFPAGGEPHDFDGEDVAAKGARRQARWTPIAVVTNR